MMTGPLRSRVDKLWDEFWTGGISNPLTVIEQITFLMFTRLLDVRETTAEKQWQRTHPGKPFKGLFGPSEQKLRWQNFSKCGGEEMLRVLRDEIGRASCRERAEVWRVGLSEREIRREDTEAG